MCQYEPTPLPGFDAPQRAFDLLVSFLVLLVVFLAALAFVNDPRSLGSRWRNDRGVVIASLVISIVPALCVTFAVCMTWWFLIPSSDAIKHWDVVQQTMTTSSCSVEDLNAAYSAASDRLGTYYNLLFGLPALCGVVGLLLSKLYVVKRHSHQVAH